MKKLLKIMFSGLIGISFALGLININSNKKTNEVNAAIGYYCTLSFFDGDNLVSQFSNLSVGFRPFGNNESEFSVYWFGNDSDISEVQVPEKSGYIFDGYYSYLTNSTGAPIQIYDSLGKVVIYDVSDSDIVLYVPDTDYTIDPRIVYISLFAKWKDPTQEKAAEDVAEEFNDNIDLYCRGGIDPILTGENSVSSTWATASEQYSQLSDKEREKFVGGQIEKIDSISFANNNTGSTIEFGQSSYSTYEPSDWDSSNFSSGYELLNFTDYKNYDENFYKTTYSDNDYNAPCLNNNDNRLCITCNFVNFGIKQNTLKDCNKIVITYDIDSINNRFGFFCTRYNHLTYSVNGVTKTKAFDYDITIGKNKTITLDVEENADILGIRFGLEADGDVFDLYLKSIEFYQTYESIYPIEEPFASFVKKYDYLYEKYGSNTEMNLDNFLNRDVTPYSSRKNLFNIKDVNDSTWIIAVVSIIGLTSVGAYFFYRKRKEE